MGAAPPAMICPGGECDDVLASAMQYDPAALPDEQPVRVCGFAAICPQPALAIDGRARELVDWQLEQAASDRAAMVLRFRICATNSSVPAASWSQ